MWGDTQDVPRVADSQELYMGDLKTVPSPGNRGDLEPFLPSSTSSIITQITGTLDWMFVSIIFHVKKSFIAMQKCFQNSQILSNFFFLKASFLLLRKSV